MATPNKRRSPSESDQQRRGMGFMDQIQNRIRGIQAVPTKSNVHWLTEWYLWSNFKGNMASKSSFSIFILAFVVVGGLVALAVTKNSAPSPYNDFAQCLTDNGVKMYGAWWCPHCQAQKKLFGNSFEKVNYVECSDASKNMNQTCTDAGIKGYPTWMFADGSTVSGEQTLATLGEKAQCEVPKVE